MPHSAKLNLPQQQAGFTHVGVTDDQQLEQVIEVSAWKRHGKAATQSGMQS